MEIHANITCLHQLLNEDLSRLLSAEASLKASLADWISEDFAPLLKVVLHRYRDLVEKHLVAINTFCQEEQIMSVANSNRVMVALIVDVDEKIINCTCPPVKDACLLAGIQTINHYKICAYGNAAAFAEAAGLEKAADIFHQVEQDEKMIDEELSHLAGREINPKALAPILLTN